MKKNKKTSDESGWNFIKIMIILVITVLISVFAYRIYLEKKYGPIEKNNEILQSDLDLIINDIEKEYGNGKKFILVEYEVKPIDKQTTYNTDFHEYNTETIGKLLEIIGYFEGESNGYFIGFSKYFKDSPYKQGNNVYIKTYVNKNFNINNYMKGVKK